MGDSCLPPDLSVNPLFELTADILAFSLPKLPDEGHWVDAVIKLRVNGGVTLAVGEVTLTEPPDPEARVLSSGMRSLVIWGERRDCWADGNLEQWIESFRPPRQAKLIPMIEAAVTLAFHIHPKEV